MKKILSILFLFLGVVTCSKYDDTTIKENISDLKNRVAALETLCARLNTNISSMQSIAEGLQSGKYLTAVAPIVEGGITVGYRLTFNTGNPIELYNGVTGSDGIDKGAGSVGATGDKGARGSVPSIVIALHEGEYYWSIDGTLLRDDDGNLLPATGEDGVAGTEAVTPQLRINSATRKWEVSYDLADSWIELGDADGDDSTELFKSIDNSDAHFFNITFNDDSQIKIAKVLSISITTSLNSVTVLPGGAIDIDYTLSGEFSDSQIETLVSERGWQATITPEDLKSGKITITAPDYVSSGEILIIVYNNMVSTTIHKISAISIDAVGYWPFNGNADDVVGTNHGVVNGATLTTDRFGNENSAYSFTVNSNIYVTNSAIAVFGQSSFSCNVWVNAPSSARSLHNIVRSDNCFNSSGWFVRFDGGRIQVWEGRHVGYEIRSPNSYNDGEWHMVTYVRDIEQKKGILYVDGALIGHYNIDTINNLVPTGIPLYFGSCADCCEYYRGSIDDISIYDRALPEEIVRALYHNH